MREGVCSSKRQKPLAQIERILPEATAYYTRELVFSPSIAIKSRPAYYTQMRIVGDILWYTTDLFLFMKNKKQKLKLEDRLVWEKKTLTNLP